MSRDAPHSDEPESYWINSHHAPEPSPDALEPERQQTDSLLRNEPRWTTAIGAWWRDQRPFIKVILVLLAIGLIGSILSSSPSDQRPASAPAVDRPALEVIEHEWGRSAYGSPVITGLVRNNTRRTYRYVQVSFNLYDARDVQVGSTFANVNNLEPGGTWRFEAIVLERQAARARLTGVSGR